MSVLNTMLGDLERRGHAPPLSLAPREEAHAPAAAPSPPLILVSERRKRPVALAVLLVAVAAAAAAVWLWPRPTPAPANPPSPALADAAPRAPVAPLPATADTPPPRTGLAALTVERIAPPDAARDPQAGEPAAAAPVAVPPVSAVGATVGEAPLLPVHPHTPTPPVGPADASNATAGSRSPASAPSSATATRPAEAATAAKAGEPAVAQSAGQSDLARAMALVARGRSTEAMQLLSAALSQRPAWNEARSALAALQAEAGDRQMALATLLGGVTFDPNHFAPTAAQLQAELNNAAGALRTLDRVPAQSRDQAYHALAGAIAQRAGQHETAVAEYGAALRYAPSNSLAWVGLAVSLQALGREEQALAAYQAAAGGTLSAEMRSFVQARIRLVQASVAAPAAQTR